MVWEVREERTRQQFDVWVVANCFSVCFTLLDVPDRWSLAKGTKCQVSGSLDTSIWNWKWILSNFLLLSDALVWWAPPVWCSKLHKTSAAVTPSLLEKPQTFNKSRGKLHSYVTVLNANFSICFNFLEVPGGWSLLNRETHQVLRVWNRHINTTCGLLLNTPQTLKWVEGNLQRKISWSAHTWLVSNRV